VILQRRPRMVLNPGDSYTSGWKARVVLETGELRPPPSPFQLAKLSLTSGHGLLQPASPRERATSSQNENPFARANCRRARRRRTLPVHALAPMGWGGVCTIDRMNERAAEEGAVASVRRWARADLLGEGNIGWAVITSKWERSRWWEGKRMVSHCSTRYCDTL
jgi:hypothetical protein